MNDFLFAGIQQVGVGTENFRRSWDWIIEMFGADRRDIVFFEKCDEFRHFETVMANLDDMAKRQALEFFRQ